MLHDRKNTCKPKEEIDNCDCVHSIMISAVMKRITKFQIYPRASTFREVLLLFEVSDSVCLSGDHACDDFWQIWNKVERSQAENNGYQL